MEEEGGRMNERGGSPMSESVLTPMSTSDRI